MEKTQSIYPKAESQFLRMRRENEGNICRHISEGELQVVHTHLFLCQVSLYSFFKLLPLFPGSQAISSSSRKLSWI